MLIVQVALAAAVCASATAKPNANIFFLLTDDQDVILGGLEPMAQVKKVCVSVCIWGCSSYLHVFASESARESRSCPATSMICGGLCACAALTCAHANTPHHVANTLTNVHTFAPLAASDR